MLAATILRSIWPVARDLATQLGLARRAACYQIVCLTLASKQPTDIKFRETIYVHIRTSFVETQDSLNQREQDIRGSEASKFKRSRVACRY